MSGKNQKSRSAGNQEGVVNRKMKSAANGRCMVEQKPHEILLPLETATRLALVAAGIGHGLAPDARGSVGQPARHGARPGGRAGTRARAGGRAEHDARVPGRAPRPGRPRRAEAPAHGLACTSKKRNIPRQPRPGLGGGLGLRSSRAGARPGMWWPAAWWC